MASDTAGLSPGTVFRQLVARDEPSELEAELKRRQASVNLIVHDDGYNLLHVALSYCAYDTAKWLLSARIDPNTPDRHGTTPLHLASADGSVESVAVVEALLAASADVSARSEEYLARLGRMPMYIAGGRTPLHVAKRAEVVNQLLAARSDLEALDLDGNTPWDVALRHGGSKPLIDVARAMRPDAAIPDAEVISAAKRADDRARQDRLTLKDVEQRMLEEADLSDGMGSDHSDDEDAPGLEMAVESPESSHKMSSDTPWHFTSPSEGLLADAGSNTYRTLRGAHIWQTEPGFSVKAAAPFSNKSVLHSAAALQAVAGTEVPPSLQPPEEAFAWCYCGRQLGKFSGQLGDGAAVNARLARGDWELCWKGCGRTPFSRLGTSGRKRVSDCVRELILSEAMALLGVPSQRGLAMFVVPSLLEDRAVASQEPSAHIQGLASKYPLFLISKNWCSNCKAAKKVLADAGAEFVALELEDANKKPLVSNLETYWEHIEASTGARTVPRVFIGGRFVGGRDDIDSLQQNGTLKTMLETAGALRSPGAPMGEETSGAALLVRACPSPGMIRMGTFDLANGPQLDPYNGRSGPSPGNMDLLGRLVAFVQKEGGAKPLLQKACRDSAALVAKWAALGLVHGMLNTDNVHISGVAIDAAGFCFMSVYDPGFDADGPPSARGRYSYRNQASAMFWNLKQLAAALSQDGHLLSQKDATAIVLKFPRLYRAAWLREMRKKLGLPDSKGVQQARADGELIESLLSVMQLTFADFTSTFRALMPPVPRSGEELVKRLAASGNALPPPEVRAGELRVRAARIRPSESRIVLQKLIGNAELRSRVACRLAQHDEADQLEEAAIGQGSIVDQSAQNLKDIAAWDLWISAYAKHCSVNGGPDREAMAAANPKFVPRPWAVEAAAVAAESGDFEPAQRLVNLLPYAFHEDINCSEFTQAQWVL